MKESYGWQLNDYWKSSVIKSRSKNIDIGQEIQRLNEENIEMATNFYTLLLLLEEKGVIKREEFNDLRKKVIDKMKAETKGEEH